MPDELAKAITRLIYPQLKPDGFIRHQSRRRDLLRVEGGIVQRLYFQVSGWGGRDFCVTACANLVAGTKFGVLAPGFRLILDPVLNTNWLPSLTADEAARSAETVLQAISEQALPYFEGIRTLVGFRTVLASERWGARHHLCLQQGIAAALADDPVAARPFLVEAISLYEADGYEWCLAYIDQAQALLTALDKGAEKPLLRQWYEQNKKAHGIA